MDVQESLKRAAEAVERSDALLITAGAGMGVDSGLPDFRGNEGFWKAYPPFKKLGKSFVEMANPQWFHRSPKVAWGFYGHRLNLYLKTSPHAGFGALLRTARTKPGGYFVFTSNVDGHFQKAGYEDDRIEECHGSIHFLQCVEPCGSAIWEVGDTALTVDEDLFEAAEPLPLCRHCGRTARPNVLMFNDWNWVSARSDLQRDRFMQWLRHLASERMHLAIIEMGAGEAVPTVRNLSESLAHQLHADFIRINPRDHVVPHPGHIALPLGAAEGISGILGRLSR
jgi:NAD-dependent SIR2 family protein deacetylase